MRRDAVLEDPPLPHRVSQPIDRSVCAGGAVAMTAGRRGCHGRARWSTRDCWRACKPGIRSMMVCSGVRGGGRTLYAGARCGRHRGAACCATPGGKAGRSGGVDGGRPSGSPQPGRQIWWNGPLRTSPPSGRWSSGCLWASCWICIPAGS